MHLLKIRNVGVGVFLALMRFLPAVILGPFIPIFLQEVMGFPAAIVGFAVLPSTLAIVLLAGVGGRLLDRRGPHVPVPQRALLMAAGMAVAALGYVRMNYWLLAVGMILQGTGMAFSNTAQTAALGEVAPAQPGHRVQSTSTGGAVRQLLMAGGDHRAGHLAGDQHAHRGRRPRGRIPAVLRPGDEHPFLDRHGGHGRGLPGDAADPQPEAGTAGVNDCLRKRRAK